MDVQILADVNVIPCLRNPLVPYQEKLGWNNTSVQWKSSAPTVLIVSVWELASLHSCPELAVISINIRPLSLIRKRALCIQMRKHHNASWSTFSHGKRVETPNQ